MKIFTKPSTAPKNNKIKDNSNRKQPPTFLDVSDKYLKYKKSASLPNKLTQKDKLGRIMKIYTALAHNEVQSFNKSLSKSKSKNSFKSYIQKSIRGSSLGSHGKNMQTSNASRIMPTKSTSPFVRNQYVSTQLTKEANNGVLHLNTQFSKNFGNLNNTNTKRLSLHQGNHREKNLQTIFSSISSFSINSNHLLVLIEKLEQILKCKLDKLFTSSFECFATQMKTHLGKYRDCRKKSNINAEKIKNCQNNHIKCNFNDSISINNQNIIPCLFKILEDCFQRFHNLKTTEMKRKLQESKSQVSAELNKYKIKLTILNKKLEQSYRKIEQAEHIIKRQEQRKKNSISVGLNTETIKTLDQSQKKCTGKKQTQFQNSKQTIKQNYQEKKQGSLGAVQLLKKIREFQKRQKELFSVLCVLKKQGVNIQRAYETVVRQLNKKQNMIQRQKKASQEQFGSNEDSQKDDEQQSFVITNLFNLNKPAKISKRKLKFDNDSENEADQSIISSIDAMSFNYEGKQPQADIFSSRVSYIPPVHLDQELQNKLKLDFQLLEEEINDGAYATV